MTIAYLFWHAAPEGGAAAYEEKLRRFGRAIAETRTPGLAHATRQGGFGALYYVIAGEPAMPGDSKVFCPSTELAIVGAPGCSLTLPEGWRATEVERRRS